MLEAITALANIFGVVVEGRQGLDRLTGVPASERTRVGAHRVRKKGTGGTQAS